MLDTEGIAKRSDPSKHQSRRLREALGFSPRFPSRNSQIQTKVPIIDCPEFGVLRDLNTRSEGLQTLPKRYNTVCSVSNVPARPPSPRRVPVRQLTFSKQAVTAGTLKNTATGKVDTVEGMADKKSQRVAWTIAGQQRPVMETGLSNLTTDTAPALIHFADGQTQQVLMVRLPEDAQAAQPKQ
jgi:hypothetical protein